MSSSSLILFLLSHSLCVFVTSAGKVDDSPTLLWPLPAKFTLGNKTLSVDPALSLVVIRSGGGGCGSGILKLGFDRYREIIFENIHGVLALNRLSGKRQSYDINKMRIVVQSGATKICNLAWMRAILCSL